MDWHKARESAHAAVRPLPAQARPLGRCLGTTLAAPLIAACDMPVATSSAMDGYAVAGIGPWRVVGSVAASTPEPAALSAGTAVSIATGAAIPAGTDAVLPVEEASERDGLVTGEPVPGRHIRRAGESFRAGTVLAEAGAAIGPVLIGLAAGAAVDELRVHGPVRVDALLTGSEVVGVGAPQPGRVRDAVGPMLRGLVPALNARLITSCRIGDGERELAAALERTTSPVVLTCGSTSAGRRDRLRGLLQRCGAEFVVDGVDCRPGHPQLLARLPSGQWLVGLPGNPGAALVASLTLLGPVVLGLLGRPLPVLPEGRLIGPKLGGHRQTRLVAVRAGHDGARVPVGRDGPASLWGSALAQELAVVPGGWDGREPVPLVTVP